MTRLTLLALLALGFVLPATGSAADPPKPLADLATDLRDPDRKKQMAAAEAIRDHYKGKSLEVLPQILAALGEVLDQLRPDDPAPEQSVLNHTEHALRQAAYGAGPGRLKVIRESTRHSDPRVRAAAFAAWLGPVSKQANIVEDRDDLLAAIRRGLKDDCPLVRGQATFALAAFWDAQPKLAGEAVSLLTTTLEDRTKPREGGRSAPTSARRGR